MLGTRVEIPRRPLVTYLFEVSLGDLGWHVDTCDDTCSSLIELPIDLLALQLVQHSSFTEQGLVVWVSKVKIRGLATRQIVQHGQRELVLDNIEWTCDLRVLKQLWHSPSLPMCAVECDPLFVNPQRQIVIVTLTYMIFPIVVLITQLTLLLRTNTMQDFQSTWTVNLRAEGDVSKYPLEELILT